MAQDETDSGPDADLDALIREGRVRLAQLEGTDGDAFATEAAALASLARRAAERAGSPGAWRAALAEAMTARERCIAVAEAGGVTARNLAAYVRATFEAAVAAEALGEATPGPDATALLSDAAAWFGEAAAGFQRLQDEGRAREAPIRALGARARRALSESRDA